MEKRVLLLLLCIVGTISAWSLPYHVPQGRAPVRVYRYAPAPPPPQYHQLPVLPAEEPEPKYHQQRPKRGHDYDDDHRETSGVTGPVHTFVKTDKNANYKWGVRHHVGDKYAS